MEDNGCYLVEREVSNTWMPAGKWYCYDGKITLKSGNLAVPTITVNDGESIEGALNRSLNLITDNNYVYRATLLDEPETGWSTLVKIKRFDPKGGAAPALMHMRTMIGLLERIMSVVYPASDTLSTYGFEIRNLLILACTECEAQWLSILEMNGYIKNRYSTNDYVQLEPILMLRKYSISFNRYPWLEPIYPFGSWRVGGNPTQDLIWYNAYNEAKHGGLNSLHKATLCNALYSLSACWVMFLSKFDGPVMGDPQDIRDYFSQKKI
ncbi:MAG: hypothetical protein P4L87_19700 [Formivibrio sp.]|nr:hypothetical protein [Formivibrio sp.]